MTYFKKNFSKQAYLKKHYPFTPAPKLTDTRFCIHCEENFIVGNFKVVIEFLDHDGFGRCQEYIVCPNSPTCSGTVIDWFPEQSSWYGVNKKPAQ
jgi:hypothetical protein